MSILLALCMVLTLLPTMATAASGNLEKDDWFYLRCMGNYLNIDASGNAQLGLWNGTTEGVRELYVENKGSNQITLKMADGRYLGIADTITDGVRVKAVTAPYLWNTYSENTGLEDRDKYSLRSPANTGMALNASGQKNEVGTHVILWTCAEMDAPENAECAFWRLTDSQIPAGAVTTPTPTLPKPTATPSKTSFVMNSKPVSVTASQFNVYWDAAAGQAVIQPGVAYTRTAS